MPGVTVKVHSEWEQTNIAENELDNCLIRKVAGMAGCAFLEIKIDWDVLMTFHPSHWKDHVFFQQFLFLFIYLAFSIIPFLFPLSLSTSSFLLFWSFSCQHSGLEIFWEQLVTWYFTKNNTSQVIGKRVSLGETVVENLESGVVDLSRLFRQDKSLRLCVWLWEGVQTNRDECWCDSSVGSAALKGWGLAGQTFWDKRVLSICGSDMAPLPIYSPLLI